MIPFSCIFFYDNYNEIKKFDWMLRIKIKVFWVAHIYWHISRMRRWTSTSIMLNSAGMTDITKAFKKLCLIMLMLLLKSTITKCLIFTPDFARRVMDLFQWLDFTIFTPFKSTLFKLLFWVSRSEWIRYIQCMMSKTPYTNEQHIKTDCY